jgi:hypothetical protein
MTKVDDYRKQLRALLEPPEDLAPGDDAKAGAETAAEAPAETAGEAVAAETDTETQAETAGVTASEAAGDSDEASSTDEEPSEPDHVWDAFLLENSGLPGPRANLELARAVSDEGDEDLFRRYIAFGPDIAPVNSPAEFLAFCGMVGFGRLMADGILGLLGPVREAASDPRWRMREAVSMALQRWGSKDFVGMMAEMSRWKSGNPFEQRAAAAALCEPAQIKDSWRARAVLKILDEITASIAEQADRKSEAFKALRKGMGYCWSVAAVASPDEGKPRMEAWLESEDPDIRWIMKENLGKKRMTRMDKLWVKGCQDRLEKDA